MNFLNAGANFTRCAIALALSEGSPAAAHQYAVNRWGRSSTAADLIAKAAVSGGSLSSWSELADTGQVVAEFISYARPMTIIGKLQGLRRVPANTPYVAQSGVAVAYWTAEGRATPVSAAAFDRATMTPLSLAALIVFAKGLLENADPAAEALIQRDLARAVVELSDRTFIDPTNTGIAGSMPAAITIGATAIASTTNIAGDLGAAIEAFEGDLETAAWVLHPKLAAQLGLRAGGRGVAADLGARGGSLAGLPAIASTACPLDSSGGTITLLDAGGICIVEEGAEIKRSSQGSVEMADDPTGDSLTPTASSKQFVSLFQTDSIGLLVTRRMNWERARAGSVVNVTGVDYATGG